MANRLTRLFNIDPGFTKLRESEEQLRADNMYMGLEVSRLKESMTDLVTFVEDLNWEKIGGWDETKGFNLKAIQENADRLQPFATVNPTIKKGLNARIGYIWSRGVSFENEPKRMVNNVRNKQTVFSKTAQWRMEMQLATAGNLWALRNKRTDEISFIPVDEIGGFVTEPRDRSRVLYWMHSYTDVSKNFRTGIEEAKTIEVFYPAYDNTTSRVNQIDGIPVDRNFEVVHVAANRQEGWTLGVPDLLAAMFWAKGHKELFEAGISYVKAQGRFASKVVSKTTSGANTTAARLADQPRRDPNTGQVLDASGTAVMSGGLDYQLMGKMSGGVDFDAFDPVAGLIAVGLGVPRDVILGVSASEEVSLEASVVDEINMRRDLWDNFFLALFGDKGNVIWPKIRTETEYRRIQSLGITAESLNTLSREEMRQLTLEAYGMEGDPNKVPDMEEHYKVVIANLIADHQGEIAAEAAEKAAAQAEKIAAAEPEPSALPGRGQAGSVGKLSTGSDEKAARADSRDPNAK